ncbi:DNA replication licensing factor Mcm5 [Planococcus citri]|uniref:DNA replication licensing factor Mcm5 n=1 Tax=Planococcus citri TaxID=170843 RepID=UPI0031F97533
MEGFDDPGIFFSDNFSTTDDQPYQQVNLRVVKKKFKEFLRQFHEENFNYKYRDTLKKQYNLGLYNLTVNIEDLSSFDEDLADSLYKQPTEYLPVFEEAAKEVADDLTHPRPEGEEQVEDIQILLTSNSVPTSVRHLKSEMISRLVRVSGIIVAASGIRAKSTKIAIQCRTCRNVIPNLPVKPGLDGYVLPRKCNTEQAGRPKCPLDPYFIIPDKCACVDYQILKLQELTDSIPQGEMPRHLQLYCDRYLCDKVVPGNRVDILGIFSIRKVSKSKGRESSKSVIGVRAPYLRVVGIEIDDKGCGFSSSLPITTEDEEMFRRLASSPNVYERIARSIVPSIFGFEDIKKAVACLLFGGSRKRLPDGLTRRGDINILLLGDPGTAKSQLLKFVQRVSPIGIYTSGKGSSAAGLTASVLRDPATRNFVMEGGAMVLADGGVVCIDEFDKMREDDRVAIHEAMEQQTISIAKAGITTTLNSRCSVLAAANSVFGRWDEMKGDENIDFMPTILSRFDMIFIVKDEHDEKRDITLAKHIMNVHMTAGEEVDESKDGEMSLLMIKKFIHFCRTTCGPRLSEAAGEKLKNRYIAMRGSSAEKEEKHKASIPITVRQLEAVIRISESLAKMQLLPFATETHVDEALRLFQVSTLEAASCKSLEGAEGFTTDEHRELLLRIEKQLKRRFPIGAQISESTIVQDFIKQKYPDRAIYTVIHTMIRRGELQHRNQRKVLYRLN